MTYRDPTTITISAVFAAFALGACSDDGTAAEETATSGITQPDTTGTGASTGGETPTTGEPPTTADTTDGPGSTSAPATTGEPGTTSEPGTTTEATTGEPVGWQPPACDSVTGTGAVTFSHDDGATQAPMDQVIVPVHYTFGLVALGKPGAMLAGSGAEILASSDAGCSWHSIGMAGGGNTPAVRLHAAGETRAYGFGDNDSVLVRVDDEQITKLTAPGDMLVGLGVDPTDPDHVRVGDWLGHMWDSTDAGVQWTPLGKSPISPDKLVYRLVFDPNDIDHVIAGTLADGVFTSGDGGQMWMHASGIGPGDANGFNLVISPADGNVVWVEGLDLEEPDDAKSRHIWRSEDGGLEFTAVVDSDDATLYNGNHLFAHPTDTDVLYFVFGSNFQNYGTDLFRYDHADGTITTTHNKWHDTVITFLPGDPSWIYMGLSIEPGGG